MAALCALAPAIFAAGCSEQGGESATANPTRPAPAPVPTPGVPDTPPEPEDPVLVEAALVERGRVVYQTNCIACHAPDPTQEGGLGPSVEGSSRELLEARILRAEYPPGYEPKADTRVMIALPHLEPELDALTAFLAQAAKKK